MWIEAQLLLGRKAVSVYQDLVEQHGFGHRYNSVKRFVSVVTLFDGVVITHSEGRL